MNASMTDIGAYIKTNNQSISIQNVDAGTDVNGDSVDRQDYLSGVIQAALGAATGSPSAQSHVFALEESSDDSTFTPALDDDGDAITLTLTADDTTSELDVDFSGLKRYLRLTYDASESSFTGGSSPTNDIYANIVLGGAQSLPV